LGSELLLQQLLMRLLVVLQLLDVAVGVVQQMKVRL
jgi:hypothetical protein